MGQTEPNSHFFADFTDFADFSSAEFQRNPLSHVVCPFKSSLNLASFPGKKKANPQWIIGPRGVREFSNDEVGPLLKESSLQKTKGQQLKVRSRPSKPNQRKGQNEKFMNFALFL